MAQLDKKAQKIIIKDLKESTEYEYENLDFKTLQYIGCNNDLYYFIGLKEYIYVFNITLHEITRYQFKKIISSTTNIVYSLLSFERGAEIPINILFGALTSVPTEKHTGLSYKGENIKVEKRWKYGDYTIYAGTFTNKNTTVYIVSQKGKIISGCADPTLEYELTGIQAYISQDQFIITNGSSIIAIKI